MEKSIQIAHSPGAFRIINKMGANTQPPCMTHVTAIIQ